VLGWTVVSWSEVPRELAAEVERRFAAHVHKTMATLRADGSPRISGTEVVLADGELWLGSMPGARKEADLRRDPRVAVHSGSDDPPDWTGDAKVAARAVESTDPADWARALPGTVHEPGNSSLFRLDVHEVSVVRLAGDSLVIEVWTPDGGLRTVQR
jgi:Pyridoxamine 5'-phosphate oxidase